MYVVVRGAAYRVRSLKDISAGRNFDGEQCEVEESAEIPRKVADFPRRGDGVICVELS